MKHLSIAILMLALCVGCGGGSSDQTTTPAATPTGNPAMKATTAPSGTAAKTPAAATPATAAGTPKTIGLLSPALTSMFHKTLIEGFTAEAQSYGWKVVSQAPNKEDNFAEQIDEVQAMVQNKVDAISICAINPEAIVGAVEEANKAGIPVFVHNSLTDLPAPAKVEAYIGYDQRKAGKECGDYSVELLKKKYGGTAKGNVFILLGVPTNGFHTVERSGGFRDVIKANPGIKIADEQSGEWLKDKGMNVAAAALSAHPDIDLFFGCSDAMDQGAAQAAKEAGKTVFTIGIDGNPDTYTDIKNGVVTATCTTNPRNMGKVDAQTIKAFFDKKPIKNKVETETSIVDSSNVDAAMKQ